VYRDDGQRVSVGRFVRRRAVASGPVGLKVLSGLKKGTGAMNPQLRTWYELHSHPKNRAQSKKKVEAETVNLYTEACGREQEFVHCTFCSTAENKSR